MMKLLTLVVCLSLVDLTWSLSSNEWANFKMLHGKSYEDPKEELMRKALYSLNKRQVEEFNSEKADELGYRRTINHMSDWTVEEKKRLNGLKVPKGARFVNSARAEQFLSNVINSHKGSLPDSLDWRDVPGRVTSVKDQGRCGSCWAFSTTGVLEGQEMAPDNEKKPDKLVALSEQNLVDCDVGNFGCGGGWPLLAFSWIWSEEGIQDETSYPYKGENGNCSYDSSKSAMTDSGAAILPHDREDILKIVVTMYGPVSVSIDDSDFEGFFHYESGIYNNTNCGNDKHELNHAVLLVGYGTDEKQGDYWIVKNSWGQNWGDQGYIKMVRNKDNQCGIATAAAVAITSNLLA